MRPKSLSASALQVAETCLSRYYAENILRAERPPNAAASLGTTVHSALEAYVKRVYLEKVSPPSIQHLLDLFRMFYMVHFETSDTDTEDYADGVAMLRRWFGRTDFSNRTVLSCEVKESFEVPVPGSESIPFNYIWDRFDQLDENVYEVVDYKSVRLPVTPEDLRGKIQARCYGLAAQIKYPNAEKIWVRFDLLRHESVATVFTRDANAATWHYVCEAADRILAANKDDLKETLNSECRWCVRKLTCNALLSNIAGGGIFTFTSALDAVDLRARLEYQRKGLDVLIQEIDEQILKEAQATEILEFETDDNKIKIGTGGRRRVDVERIEHLLDRELFYRYGGPMMNLKNFDALLKDEAVRPDLRAKLKEAVYHLYNDPTVRVVEKNKIDRGRP